MSVAKKISLREWVTTSELVEVYGQTPDFYQKLSKTGEIEIVRAGLGPRARIMFNLADFERWWAERRGKVPCQKVTVSSGRTIRGGRARDVKAKNSKSDLIQKIRALAGSVRMNG